MAGKDNDGRVGYKRPPLHTRFKPGQSGNPKGRPRHARNLKTEFLEELCEPIRVREGDREMKISKQRALVKSLIGAAIKDDMRAASAIVSFCTRIFGNEPEDDQPQSTASDDLEILNEFVGREVRRRAAQGDANGHSQPQPQNMEPSDEK
jgi:Family of unknown function (DUF5681)